MTNSKDDFREAVEDTIWAYTNVDSEDRAEVLRQFADELDAEESPFDEKDEQIRKRLEQFGYEFPRTGDE